MHILYSFKRCPYAMRVRMVLCLTDIQCELREVSLKNKPSSMLDISPKGTVPVLLLDNGKVIEKGTHNELIQLKDGEYAKSWKVQLEDNEKNKGFSDNKDSAVNNSNVAPALDTDEVKVKA